jgi:hypothetical protein
MGRAEVQPKLTSTALLQNQPWDRSYVTADINDRADSLVGLRNLEAMNRKPELSVCPV